MSNFIEAYQLTNKNEGGFAFNPADSGGETYKGIARNFWPNWSGWKYVDGLRKQVTPMPHYGTGEYRSWVKYFDSKLAEIISLQNAVKNFYEVNFWNLYSLSDVVFQEVANWIYDHVVNAGGRGAMWAQLAAGVKPDGDIGPKSIAAINSCDPVDLLNRCEDVAAAFRLDRCHSKPSQLQFLVGWLRRDGQPEEIIQLVRKAAADGCLDDLEVSFIKNRMEATV